MGHCETEITFISDSSLQSFMKWKKVMENDPSSHYSMFTFYHFLISFLKVPKENPFHFSLKLNIISDLLFIQSTLQPGS